MLSVFRHSKSLVKRNILKDAERYMIEQYKQRRKLKYSDVVQPSLYLAVIGNGALYYNPVKFLPRFIYCYVHSTKNSID